MAYISNNIAGEDWQARVARLIYEEEKSMTPNKFFSSNELNNAARRICETLITGDCTYLRSIGFNVDASVEKRILKNLDIQITFDTSETGITALSTSTSQESIIIVNAGNVLIQRYKELSDQYYAFLGMLIHELAHILFTSFPTLCAWKTRLEAKKWYPTNPDNANTAQGINLDAARQDDTFNQLFVQCAWGIGNAIEDGYIENEMIEMYPGICKMALATVNTQLLMDMKPMAKELDVPEPHVFSALDNQILQYAKFETADYEDPNNADASAAFEAIMPILDDARINRDPDERCKATNSIMVILAPFLDDELKQAQQQQQKNSNQQQQQKNQQSGQPNPGSGSSGSQSSASAASISGRMAANAAKNGIGGNQKSNTNGIGNTSSATNKGKRLPNTNNSGTGSNGGQPKGPGASSGASSDSAEKRQFDDLLHKVAKQMAQSQAEKERTAEMNRDANGPTSPCGVGNVSVVRAPEVSDANIKAYNKNASFFIRTAADLTRSIQQILKDRREGGRRKNLVMGSRFETSHWCTADDFRDFSKIKWPTESPTFSFGVLVDESSSTKGPLIDAASMAAIVLELFADSKRGLDIKHIIAGYTTGNTPCQIRSYAEPNHIDNNDVYRITGMHASGGTPTAAAMEYMRNRLNGLRTDIKMMIVISDGESGDNEYYGNNRKDTKILRLIANCRKEHIIVVAAGIGLDRDEVKKEFGDDNFLDISDLEKMPAQLASIIKESLWV